MNVSSLTNTNPQNTTGNNNTIPVPTQMLSQQDFLNLLVAQMTAQDPLNPTNSQDLLSQMVQFSTLNSNTTMQTDLSQLTNTQQFSIANTLLGKQVTVLSDPTNNTTIQGIVSGVDTSGSTPQITVNGQSFPLALVLSVSNPSSTQ